MLEEEKNNKEENNEYGNFEIDPNALKLIGILAVFIFMICFIIMSGKGSPRKEVYTVNEDLINKDFEKIDKNYTVEIKKTINGESVTITKYEDDKTDLTLYEDSSSDVKGYFLYKGVAYSAVDYNNIKKLDKLPEFMSDNLSNIELIKKVFTHCEYEGTGKVKAVCNIKLSDFILEYNSLFSTNYEVSEDKTVQFDLVYFSNKISKVSLDYTDINKIVNNKDELIVYEIVFSSIGENDFTDVMNNYKNVFK